MTIEDAGKAAEPCFSLRRAPAEYRSQPPAVLFRRFERKESAENFFRNGEVRFRSLGYYRRLEEQGDARGDLAEGTIFSQLPDGTTLRIKDRATGEWGNALKVTNARMTNSLNNHEKFFVSCYSQTNRPSHRKFGKYVVKIRDVEQYVSAIQAALLTPDCLFWGSIKYFDPEAPGTIVDDDNSLWLSKRISFSDEDEFRLVFFVDGYEEGQASKAFGKIELGPLNDVAEFFEDQE